MTLNDQFAFERLQRRIDDPKNKAVVVVIVNEDDTLDTATVGIDNPVGLWGIFFSLTSQLSDEVMATFTPQQRAQSLLVLPSREIAKEHGILRDFRPRSS